jgi:DNA repair protein RecN (Recombination protein N)
MLKSLSIQNYAIIQDLNIDFSGGLSIITGETGAGKSILLGALSLIIGQRSDSSVLYDNTRKCVVEGEFAIKGYGLEDLFEQNELDYADITLIRREISADGKSRAFINDTPVNVSILKEFGERLIDVHSQHQNLYIDNQNFQLKVLDTFARQNDTLQEYKTKFSQYKALYSEYQKKSDEYQKNKADLEYFQFQYNQLCDIKLTDGEQELLEAELQTLTHAEEIKSHLGMVLNYLEADESSIILFAKDSINYLNKIRSVFAPSAGISDRLSSVLIELKDIASEINEHFEKTESDPERSELVKQRLDIIYGLEQKHHVTNVKALLDIEADLKSRIDLIDNADTQMDALKIQLDQLRANLENIAAKLSANRKNVIPIIEEKVTSLLQSLGMPNAIFRVQLDALPDLALNGSDAVRFLFSANKQAQLQDLGKVASGGEMARLMLSIKAVIAEVIMLPTIIFDEIDQGVSGDIADKMGNVIVKLSHFAQIINITHLPQIASKGENHYLVYKSDLDHRTQTQIKKLNPADRVIEIARMLSGEQLSEAAINNAKALLGIV